MWGILILVTCMIPCALWNYTCINKQQNDCAMYKINFLKDGIHDPERGGRKSVATCTYKHVHKSIKRQLRSLARPKDTGRLTGFTVSASACIRSNYYPAISYPYP